MSERIRLRTCPACQTAIPPHLPVCPECGARQEGVTAPPASSPGTGPGGGAGPGGSDEAGPEGYPDLDGLFGGEADMGSLAGPMLRVFLGRNLGCLGTLLLLLFVPALLVGLLVDDVAGALGSMLLGVGILGLLLTAWLIRLLLPRGKDRGNP